MLSFLELSLLVIAACWIAWLGLYGLYLKSGPKGQSTGNERVKGSAQQSGDLAIIVLLAYFVSRALVGDSEDGTGFQKLGQAGGVLALGQVAFFLRQLEMGRRVEFQTDMQASFSESDRSALSALQRAGHSPFMRAVFRSIVGLAFLILFAGVLLLPDRLQSRAVDQSMIYGLTVAYSLTHAWGSRATLRAVDRRVATEVGAEAYLRLLAKFYGRLPAIDSDVFARRNWLSESDSYLVRAARVGVQEADARSWLFDARREAECEAK